jgi:HAD superfamily hydrolase (TIGR01484 family)
MLSLDELSSETALEIEGVVFDVDDTLTRHGVIEEEAYSALFRLRDAGLARIAVTGRPLGWIEPLVHLWPIDLGIGENGAGWLWRDGRVARESFFDGEVDFALLERVRARVRTELPDIEEANDGRLRRRDVAFDIGETVRLSRNTIETLVRVIEECGARTFVSSVHVHAVVGTWDKAKGVIRAANEVLGVSEGRLKERFLFVGDSGNDAAAFAFFAQSAGVANVRAHLPQLTVPPRFVAQQEYGRGFAEIVDALIAKRKGAAL